MGEAEAQPVEVDWTIEIAHWMARARAWLDELQSPTGLRASSVEGHFHALFGRDTLWSVMLSLEASRLRPGDRELALWVEQLARTSLQALAVTQGTREHDAIEEQPGKIVHEFWPETPEHLRRARWPMEDGRYYGSADATYLFLMAAAMVWQQCAGGGALIDELWDHVAAALHWALRYGDVDGEGLVEAWPRQPLGLGLTNQVWKDSGDALILEDGSVPEPPVAWVELQGYAIAAYRGVREMLQARGEDAALQDELARRAARLEVRLDQFWLPGEGCPAMALTREKTPVPIVSSNMGHLLWCGALREERAEATANRLLLPDMISTWGLRTVSAHSYAFEPFSYHRGSIWPFDNAIAAGGLWRMGRREDARSIGRRVQRAIQQFGTPVELYCALPATWVREPDVGAAGLLVDYRRASAVQAWSCAAVLLFAAQLLTEG
jgi:glycogen debranching enzyme